jgi:hypothetical protein
VNSDAENDGATEESAGVVLKLCSAYLQRGKSLLRFLRSSGISGQRKKSSLFTGGSNEDPFSE